MKITSPIKDYSDTTSVGPHTLEFKNGVAEADDLSDGAKAWLKAHGYGIGSAKAASPDARPEPADPRKVSDERVGTRTRDGAVDPHKGDFLGPTNAGKGNPHGSSVVSPEIHASQGTRPIKGGEVHVDDPAAQDKAEKDHVTNATDGTPITSVPDEDAAREAQQPLPSNPHGNGPADEQLKGAALDEALEEAGLSKTGTADEKRARLAEHQA